MISMNDNVSDDEGSKIFDIFMGNIVNLYFS